MEQMPLFDAPPVVLQVSADRQESSLWRLRILLRCEGESWDEAAVELYEDLTLSELFDVICCEVSHRLQLT